MYKPTILEKVRYWFDGIMSRGVVALVGLLGLASLAFIAIVSLLVLVFRLYPRPDGHRQDLSFGEALWSSLLRTLDPGTMGGDEGIGFRGAMLVVTIGGVILVASLISVISSAFNSRVEDLRKGRSRVLESEHTLILGWSSKVFPIVRQICLANESRGRAAVVILAVGDKVKMEDEIRSKITSPKKTRIIVRSGDPMDLTDLEVVSPHNARSVIILAPEDSSDPDSVVIKTALAITNNPRRKSGKYHIVAELQDAANIDAAQLVGRDEVNWILTSDLIGRITVQASRQSGLSIIYTELLDFGGDEIYFSDQPTLVGKTYFEAAMAFETSCVIGILTGDSVVLNPQPDTIYGPHDKLILIAEDDSTIVNGAPPTIDGSALSDGPQTTGRGPEHALVLGYNVGLHMMLDELNQYVAAGSRVTVVADVDEPGFHTYDNMTVEFTRGNVATRSVLNNLGVGGYDHIIVLSYQGLLDPQRADARTLITLLHLRDMADLLDLDLHIVSEMLDDRNRELAEVARADDFIVSDKLVSLMLAQMSENDRLFDVFDSLFASQGSEIYLRPAEEYVTPGEAVDFFTILEAACRRGETAIGYRVAEHARNSAHKYGVVINPSKRDKRTFAREDRIIVLASTDARPGLAAMGDKFKRTHESQAGLLGSAVSE